MKPAKVFSRQGTDLGILTPKRKQKKIAFQMTREDSLFKSVDEEKIIRSDRAEFVPFRAKAVADVPFLSAPATSAAALFTLLSSSEVNVISARTDHKKQLWY